MSLFVTSLNSGSNGNCYYIGNEREAILVDAGIPCREVEARMNRLGLSMQTIKGIFVSHEHKDHIKGVHSLVKKYRVPVYITETTKRNGHLTLQRDLVMQFNTESPVFIGDLAITAFRKYHDASDPYSFMISCKGIKVGVFTDIGVPCQQVIKHFQQCHAAFLESNYDEHMLETGSYPHVLKNRIKGGRGHLSNRQALDLFKKHKPPFMSHLFLSHLSQNNNSPELVEKLFNENAGKVKMVVTSRYSETAVYHISYQHENQPAAFPVFFSSTQLAFSFE